MSSSFFKACIAKDYFIRPWRIPGRFFWCLLPEGLQFALCVCGYFGLWTWVTVPTEEKPAGNRTRLPEPKARNCGG